MNLSIPGTKRALSALLFFLLFLGLNITHAQTDSATLSWRPSSGPNTAGYILEYGTSSGNYTGSLNVGLTTVGTLSNLAAGTTYYCIVIAYDTTGLQSLPSNQVSFMTPPMPSVSLTSPSNGSIFAAPATVVFSASAAETGGSVSYVDFYNGATLLGEATTSPYTFTWSNIPTGTYSVTAVAYDPSGASMVSSAVSLTVVQTPVINSMQLLSNGSFSFTVNAGAGGVSQTYNVWVSEDLQNWTLLQTVTSSASSFVITDPGAASARSRFYAVSIQ